MLNRTVNLFDNGIGIGIIPRANREVEREVEPFAGVGGVLFEDCWVDALGAAAGTENHGVALDGHDSVEAEGVAAWVLV